MNRRAFGVVGSRGAQTVGLRRMPQTNMTATARSVNLFGPRIVFPRLPESAPSFAVECHALALKDRANVNGIPQVGRRSHDKGHGFSRGSSIRVAGSPTQNPWFSGPVRIATALQWQ